MAITVTQRPSITSPAASKWNAVGNPILYKFTRKDYNITAVANSGGALQITVNTNLVTLSAALGGPVVIGNTMWVKTDNGIYDALYTVVSVTNAASSVVTFSASTYISAATTGYINLTQRKNYKVSIGIYTSSLIGTIRVSPDRRGDIVADISRVLWSALSPDLNINLTSANTVKGEVDSGAFTSFYIKYTEQWIGSAQSETSDSANVYYSVYGAAQIPATYGGNLVEYVVSEKVQVLNDTDFTTGWTNESTGESWTLGALTMVVSIDQTFSKRARTSLAVSSGLTLTIDIEIENQGTPPYALIVYLSNGQSIDYGVENSIGVFTKSGSVLLTSSITYFEVYVYNEGLTFADIAEIYVTEVTAYTSAQNKFLTKLDNYVMWRGWPMPISVIIGGEDANPDYLYASGGGNTVGSFQPGDPSLCLFDLNKIIIDQSSDLYTIAIAQSVSNLTISEIKNVVVYDACDNPIMLLGRNTLDGCLVWLFDFSQEYTFSYEDGRKAKRLLLTAENLTLNQWESLQDFITLGEVYRENITELLSTTLKTSSRIGSQVYAVDQEGNKIGVIVIPTQNTTRTKQERHVFQIEIEYPQEFTT